MDPFTSRNGVFLRRNPSRSTPNTIEIRCNRAGSTKRILLVPFSHQVKLPHEASNNN